MEMIWPFKKKPKRTFCLNCGNEVDIRVAPTIRFQYFENDEPKIATSHLCENCAGTFKDKDDDE